MFSDYPISLSTYVVMGTSKGLFVKQFQFSRPILLFFMCGPSSSMEARTLSFITSNQLKQQKIGILENLNNSVMQVKRGN